MARSRKALVQACHDEELRLYNECYGIHYVAELNYYYIYRQTGNPEILEMARGYSDRFWSEVPEIIKESLRVSIKAQCLESGKKHASAEFPIQYVCDEEEEGTCS